MAVNSAYIGWRRGSSDSWGGGRQLILPILAGEGIAVAVGEGSYFSPCWLVEVVAVAVGEVVISSHVGCGRGGAVECLTCGEANF
jgi:hypothetical protein